MGSVLGYPSTGNLKAEKGNVLHKVLETLAQYKLALQNKETKFSNDAFGEVQANPSECDPRVLLDKAYDYYKSRSTNKWDDVVDKEECWAWVKVALEYQKGRFDPRLNTIVSPEQHFDIEVPHSWGEYYFRLGDEEIKGKLRIKGTIDLIQEAGKNYYEIVDYKTGSRRDWITGTEKTPEKLNKDTQLKLYYYAARLLYPNIKNISVTIYFLNHGGPFTIAFDDNTVTEIEYYLKATFNKIKGTLITRKNISFDRRKLNCTWCDFYKQKNKNGQTICDEVHKNILKEGINKTTMKYMQDKSVLTTYQEGGGSTEHGKKNLDSQLTNPPTNV